MVLRNYRLFLGAMGVGAAALVLFVAAPPASRWQVCAWIVSLLLPLAVLAVRIGSSRPGVRCILGVLLAGALLKVGGALAWYVIQLHATVRMPFPTPIDAVFLLVHILQAGFLLMVLKRRGGARWSDNRIVLIDAIIVAAAAFAPLWVWGIAPRLGPVRFLPGAAIAVYSAVTLLLLMLAARVALSPGFFRTILGPLTLLGFTSLLLGDTVYGMQSAAGGFRFGGPIMLTWMAARTALAGLAAHPSLDAALRPGLGGRASYRAAPWRADDATPSRHHAFLLAATLVPVGAALVSGGAPSVLLMAAAFSFVLLTYRMRLLAGDLEGHRRLTTELNAAVEQLGEQRDTLARYATAVSSTEDAVITTSAAGVIVDWNRGAELLYGWTREEAHGQHITLVASPGETDLFEDTLAVLATGQNACLEARDRRKDGSTVQTSVTISNVYDDGGQLTARVVIARDISAQKAREAELHRESKLEALGRLSAGLAHEINSPMQFVGDNARFLEEAYRELIRAVGVYRGLLDSANSMSWAERQERMRQAEAEIDFNYLEQEIPSAVQQTLEGIDRVSSIVRAMKTFSHPGHEEHVPADLNEAVEATVTVTRSQVKEAADVELQLGELPPVICNIADLNQVFLNLIVNAADAIVETGRRGRITVSTSRDGEQAVIAISDTGSGISDELRARIFDPFFTTKEVGRGSGQGLPLARAVVQDGHGGLLSVTSTRGQGSTFTIRIPIAGQQATAPAIAVA